MQRNKLVTTILKLALDTEEVKPEEVMAVLQQKAKGKTEDKNTETVDGDVIDSEQPTQDDIDNQEGKILESSFKELEVEDAIEKAKELKALNTPINLESIKQENNSTVQKVATYWDLLRDNYKK